MKEVSGSFLSNNDKLYEINRLNNPTESNEVGDINE